MTIPAGERSALPAALMLMLTARERSTTLPGSEGRIRVSHKLQVRIKYQRSGEEQTRQLAITKNVTMQSCCTAEAITFLPSYSKKAPKIVVQPQHSRCLCKMDLKDVFDRDGAMLERAGPIDYPDDTRLLGIEGDVKSPSWTALMSFDGSA